MTMGRSRSIGSCLGARAAGLGLGLAIALAAAAPALAQTAPPPSGGIVVEPLPPPIGGSEPLPPEGGGPTLPQPRFVRAPSANDAGQGQEAGQGLGLGPGTGAAAPAEPQWERSPDGRFYRAPKTDSAAPADAPATVVPIEPPDTALRAGARLRELDKMTGQTRTFEINVGETREVERLRVELDACRSPEGNDTHGTMAFLKVWDIREPADELFSGWMFAESPALSAIDHPRYDLWVISCTTDVVAGSEPRQ
jgi:hypothetical protein